MPDDNPIDEEELYLMERGYTNIKDEKSILMLIYLYKPDVVILAGAHADLGVMGKLSADKLRYERERLGIQVHAKIYLLGCYQGREKDRKNWEDAFGANVEGIKGLSHAETNKLFLRAVIGGTNDIELWFQIKKFLDFWYNIFSKEE